MVLTIVVMLGLVYYNILLECDHIYTVKDTVSSFFHVMMFPHEGHLIINSLTMILPHMLHIKKPHHLWLMWSPYNMCPPP